MGAFVLVALGLVERVVWSSVFGCVMEIGQDSTQVFFKFSSKRSVYFIVTVNMRFFA